MPEIDPDPLDIQKIIQGVIESEKSLYNDQVRNDRKKMDGIVHPDFMMSHRSELSCAQCHTKTTIPLTDQVFVDLPKFFYYEYNITVNEFFIKYMLREFADKSKKKEESSCFDAESTWKKAGDSFRLLAHGRIPFDCNLNFHKRLEVDHRSIFSSKTTVTGIGLFSKCETLDDSTSHHAPEENDSIYYTPWVMIIIFLSWFFLLKYQGVKSKRSKIADNIKRHLNTLKDENLTRKRDEQEARKEKNKSNHDLLQRKERQSTMPSTTFGPSQKPRRDVRAMESAQMPPDNRLYSAPGELHPKWRLFCLELRPKTPYMSLIPYKREKLFLLYQTIFSYANFFQLMPRDIPLSKLKKISQHLSFELHFFEELSPVFEKYVILGENYHQKEKIFRYLRRLLKKTLDDPLYSERTPEEIIARFSNKLDTVFPLTLFNPKFHHPKCNTEDFKLNLFKALKYITQEYDSYLKGAQVCHLDDFFHDIDITIIMESQDNAVTCYKELMPFLERLGFRVNPGFNQCSIYFNLECLFQTSAPDQTWEKCIDFNVFFGGSCAQALSNSMTLIGNSGFRKFYTQDNQVMLSPILLPDKSKISGELEVVALKALPIPKRDRIRDLITRRVFMFNDTYAESLRDMLKINAPPKKRNEHEIKQLKSTFCFLMKQLARSHQILPKELDVILSFSRLIFNHSRIIIDDFFVQYLGCYYSKLHRLLGTLPQEDDLRTLTDTKIFQILFREITQKVNIFYQPEEPSTKQANPQTF